MIVHIDMLGLIIIGLFSLSCNKCVYIYIYIIYTYLTVSYRCCLRFTTSLHRVYLSLSFVIVKTFGKRLPRWQVVVSGAGPAGLLAARSILDHRPDVEVDVFEKRGDSIAEFLGGKAEQDDEAPVCGKTMRKTMGEW